MTQGPARRRGIDPHDDGRDGEPEVLAGGGVVVDGAGRVLLVHRSRYDDWSLPKGKLDPGETLAECAVREVAEETGFACSLGAEIAVTRYVDHKGRDKLVRYWLMTVTGGAFEPNDEVDEIRWVAPAEAILLLTYSRDRGVVSSAVG